MTPVGASEGGAPRPLSHPCLHAGSFYSSLVLHLIYSKRLFLSTTWGKTIFFSCCFFWILDLWQWSKNIAQEHFFALLANKNIIILLPRDGPLSFFLCSFPSTSSLPLHPSTWKVQYPTSSYYPCSHSRSQKSLLYSFTRIQVSLTFYSLTSLPHFLLTYNAFPLSPFLRSLSLSLFAPPLFSLALCGFRQVMLTLTCRGWKWTQLQLLFVEWWNGWGREGALRPNWGVSPWQTPFSLA